MLDSRKIDKEVETMTNENVWWLLTNDPEDSVCKVCLKPLKENDKVTPYGCGVRHETCKVGKSSWENRPVLICKH